MNTPSSSVVEASLHLLCTACRKLNRVPAERLGEHAQCGNCHRPLFPGHAVAVSEADFQAHLRLDELPLLVDMWAPWCGPCRTMAPQFERAAGLLEPRMRLLKLDIDQAQASAARYGIRSIPTVVLFHRGKVIGQVTGAQTTEALVHWARSHAP